MKLFLTLIITLVAYFVMVHYGVSSLFIWVVFIIFWSAIDYFTYQNPFSWSDYIILVIIVSAIEISTWYDYFGFL